MAHQRITSTVVERSKAPASGRIEYWDDLLPGFVLRITASNVRTYGVMTRVHGRRIRITLGKHPLLSLKDARQKAREALEKASNGEDPRQSNHSPDQAGFESVAGLFLKRYAGPKVRESTAKEYARLLDREVIPVWRDRDIQTIRKADVIMLVEGIVDRGAPYVANRTLAVIRKLFRWAVQRDLLEVSPASDVAAPHGEEQRDRVLDSDELRAVWEATGTLTPAYRDYMRTLILTGQRSGEVRTMKWRDVDLDGALWCIPAAANKPGRVHTVPLTPAVVEILKGIPDQGSEYVFTINGKKPVNGLSKVKATIEETMAAAARGEAAGQSTMPPMNNWRLHDLRRSAATGMARCGVSRIVITRVLNHADTGVTAIYERHTYDHEKRGALTAWADHVMGVVEGNASNVVPLRA